jgi:hypothetical protein
VNTSTQLTSNTLTITDLVTQHNIFINTESFNVSDQISGEETNDTKNISTLDISGLQITYTDFNTASNNLSTVIDKESITISAVNDTETLQLTYNEVYLLNTENQEKSVLYPASLTITDLETEEFSKLNATGLTTNTLTLNTSDGLLVDNVSIDFSSPANNNVLLVDSANNQLMYLDSYISTEGYQTTATAYWVDGENVYQFGASNYFTAFLNRVGSTVYVSILLIDDTGTLYNQLYNQSGVTADSLLFVIFDAPIQFKLDSTAKPNELYQCSEKITVLTATSAATAGITNFVDWFNCNTYVSSFIDGIPSITNDIVLRMVPDCDKLEQLGQQFQPRVFCLNTAYANLGVSLSVGSGEEFSYIETPQITFTYQIF